MSVTGLDLGYWKNDNLWLEGWRPDDFFGLPEDVRDRITERVKETDYSWILARRLTEEAVASQEQGGEDG